MKLPVTSTRFKNGKLMNDINESRIKITTNKDIKLIIFVLSTPYLSLK